MDEFAELENDLSEEYDSSSVNPKLDGNLKKRSTFFVIVFDDCDYWWHIFD